jgi:hypothetical protein
MDKIQVFPGRDGDFYWRRVAPNGDIIAIGGEGYTSRIRAHEMTYRASSADFEVENLDHDPRAPEQPEKVPTPNPKGGDPKQQVGPGQERVDAPKGKGETKQDAPAPDAGTPPAEGASPTAGDGGGEKA